MLPRFTLFTHSRAQRLHSKISYGNTPDRPWDSGVEECKGFDRRNEWRPLCLLLSSVDPDMDLLLLLFRHHLSHTLVPSTQNLSTSNNAHGQGAVEFNMYPSLTVWRVSLIAGVNKTTGTGATAGVDLDTSLNLTVAPILFLHPLLNTPDASCVVFLSFPPFQENLFHTLVSRNGKCCTSTTVGHE